MSQPAQPLHELRRAAFLAAVSDSLRFTDGEQDEMYAYLMALAERDWPLMPQEQEAEHKWPTAAHNSEFCPICCALRHYCQCGKKPVQEGRTPLKGLWPERAPE